MALLQLQQKQDLQIPAQEKNIVNYVMENFQIAKSAKEQHFKAGFDNTGAKSTFDLFLDYYLGKQLSSNPKLTDVVFNNMTTIIQSSLSITLQTPLTIELIPESDNEDEQKKVYELNQVLQHYWLKELEMQKKLEELLLNLKIYGTAYLYPHYIIENNLIHLKMDVISPKYIYPDSSCIEHKNAEFIIYSAPIPLVKIRRWYERGKYVTEEYDTSLSTTRKNRVVEILHDNLSFLSPTTGQQSTTKRSTLPSANLIIGFFKDDTKEMTMIHSVAFVHCGQRHKQDVSINDLRNSYVRCPICNFPIPHNQLIIDTYGRTISNLKYPRGRMIVIANNILLDDRPNPYYNFPFLKFININSTKYWGLGDVEYLLGEQIALNKMVSKTMEIIDKHTKRPLFTDEGAIQKEVEFTEYGLKIEKQPGSGVAWMDMPPFPNEIFTTIELLKAQMDNKAGLMDRGRAKTATEVSLISEQEQNRQTTLLSNVELELEKVVLHLLHILTNYHTYTEQIALQFNKPEIVLFKGTDYQNLMFQTRVKFQTDIVQSKLVKHNQALQTLQLITTLISSQLLPVEQGMNMVNKLLKDLGLPENSTGVTVEQSQ
ncbi:MAG: phage portal protein [bacterium]